MEFDEFEEGGFSSYAARQLARFPASHHGSPLTYFPQRHVVKLLNGDYQGDSTVVLRAYREVTLALNERMGLGYVATEDPSEVYYHFLARSTVDSGFSKDLAAFGASLRRAVTIACNDVLADVGAIVKSHPGLKDLAAGVENARDDSDKISIELALSFSSRAFLEKIRNTIQQNHVNRIESMIDLGREGDYHTFTCRDLSFFIRSRPFKTIALLNYDQLLMLLDTVSCRLMTRVAVLISESINRDNLPPWPLLRKIYNWGDLLIRDYGVEAYSLIGEFESIVTGIFITFQGTDPLGLGDSFFQHLTATAEGIETENGVSREHLASLLVILRSIKSINHLSEIFGLRKHWGNPMVDAKASGASVQEKVAEVLPIEGTALTKLLASFVRMVVTEFIKQHGKWPEGYFSGELEFPLRTAHATGITRLPETHLDHKHEHWSLFHFLPNCIIDSYRNDLALTSDRSISVYREHLDTTYVRALCQVPIPDKIPEDRRLILEYLRTDHLSILDIFKIIMSDAIPSSWLANSASMKGTEMKHHKARIFAVLTYEMRQYFAATEDLIKNHLFRYNPHQTMTMGETELLGKLRSITRQLDPTGDSRHLCVMHIVDFSKWNLRMRYSNTCLIFKAIDDFLGTPGLIEQTHNIFGNMVNVVQDAFNPPELGVLNTESETIWRNHLCGWEGQRQKGWTILTSALLSDLERVTGVHSTICGQGDNQTLLAKFAVPDCYRNPHEWISVDPEGVRKTVDTYYSHLERECNSVGLKIKTAETCRSLNFFNYGKRLYMNGVELSMALKRISKTITEPNESYPTAESLLKTLEGSAFAAGLYSHPSLIPFLMSRFAVCLQLEACFANNQLIGKTGVQLLQQHGFTSLHNFLSSLMKIPASLGGPPQLSIASYLYRGHPDPLCTDLVIPSLKAKHGCQVSQKLIACALSGIWFSQTTDKKDSLINSPYSLCLDIPLSCRQPIEHEIKPALRLKCKNSMVRGMFQVNMDQFEAALYKALGQITPLHPLILNDIYSRSLPGRRKAFVSGLANTTSLGRLILDSGENPLIVRIQDLERKQLISWIIRVRNIMDAVLTNSGYDPHHILADKLRLKSWGEPLVGVTVPHPLEQFMIVKSKYDLCTDNCRTAAPEHLVLIRHSENLIDSPGVDVLHVTSRRSRAGSPYLGSTITEGIIQKQLICLNPDETWRDVIRLNTLRKWIANKGSVLDKYMLSLIESRTDVDQDVIDLATGIPSRLSFNHRASLMSVIPACGVSTTTNMHSRLYLSSNRMGEYSYGENNFHMAFGPAFLCFQELLCMDAVANPSLWSQTERDVFHIHVRANDVPVVFDHALELACELPATVRVLNTPEVLFASRDVFEFDTPSGSVSDCIWHKPEQATTFEVRIGYCFQLIGDSFVRETIVRETLTQHRVSDYERRPCSVSIGDIGLVGVANVIKSIAWNCMLICPASIWNCASEPEFCLQAHDFLSLISSGFWDTFATPISSVRNRQELLLRYPRWLGPTMTRQTMGIRSTLLYAVLTEMWLLLEEMKCVVYVSDSVSPMPLFAPSIQSLKYLTAKYVEFSSFLCLRQVGVNFCEACIFSRNLSANILSASAEGCKISYLLVREKLRRRLNEESTVQPMIPHTKMYPLQYPWIDRLRCVLKPAGLVTENHQVVTPRDYPSLQSAVHLLVPECPVVTPLPQCDCPPAERQSALHTECFFLRSGYYSKSHHKFLDIAWSLALDVSGVMCLGSSTGSEAYSFASLVECERVYVNCLHPLSDFSPHLAGSYIPVAFSSGSFIEKLINPSPAVTSDSDLLHTDTIDSILAHTEEVYFTGLTCDAEFPKETTIEKELTLIKQLCSLISQKASIQWCICKVVYGCQHDICKLTSALAQQFIQVHVVLSPFTRPKSLIMYLVGSQRRPFNSLRWDSNEIPTTILNNEAVHELCHQASTQTLSPLFTCGVLERTRRMLTTLTGPDSFQFACLKYLPGFCIPDSLKQDREGFLRELTAVIKSLKQQVKSILEVEYRVHTGMGLRKNAILQLTNAALHSRLNGIFEKVNRCELLKRLLMPPELSLEVCIRTVKMWLSRTHKYPMTSRPFVLDLNASTFINTTSRYLFEILGHIYHDNFTGVEAFPADMLFHHKNPIGRPRELTDLFSPLPLQRLKPKSDLRWLWKRRSELVTWMFVAHLLDTPVQLSTPSSYLLDEFQARGKLLQLCKGWKELDKVCLHYVQTVDDFLTVFHTTTSSVLCVVVETGICPIALQVLSSPRVYKLPWSGLVPRSVLIMGEKGTTTSDHVEYPCFDDLLNASSTLDNTFQDCRCWDCSIETVLCQEFHIQHMFLDQLCSLKSIESVRDMQHQL